MRSTTHVPDGLGAVRIEVVCTVEGVNYELEATFPQLYPYFRPEVRSKANFDFHQEPFGNRLCLAARDPENWSTTDSLAGFISSQLPLLIAANFPDADRADDVEENVPEPIREYYNYPEGDFVLIDSGWKIPAGKDYGTFDAGVLVGELPLRAAVLEVRDADGEVLAAADPRLAGVFQQGKFTARWARIHAPVVEQNGGAFLGSLKRRHPDLVKRGPWRALGRHHIDLLALVYPDEIRYAEYDDDWVFLLQVKERRPAARAAAPIGTHLIRALRGGPEDMAARVPQLRELRDKRVAIIGVGALGAPAATALARCGVGHLALLDNDFVEPGNAPRWPLGVPASGTRKVQSIGGFIAQHYPYTVINAAVWRLGDVGNEEANDAVVLDLILSDADLVLDATANTAANHAIAELAWERRLPYICATATAGAWGGIVARIERGRTACWGCYNAALGSRIALPPADTGPSAEVTPIACSETTFVGAGFDLTPLSDEAVRITVSRLSESSAATGFLANRYPSVSWDVEVLALRTAEGVPRPPTWTEYDLPPSQDCPFGICNAE